MCSKRCRHIVWHEKSSYLRQFVKTNIKLKGWGPVDLHRIYRYSKKLYEDEQLYKVLLPFQIPVFRSHLRLLDATEITLSVKQHQVNKSIIGNFQLTCASGDKTIICASLIYVSNQWEPVLDGPASCELCRENQLYDKYYSYFSKGEPTKIYHVNRQTLTEHYFKDGTMNKWVDYKPHTFEFDLSSLHSIDDLQSIYTIFHGMAQYSTELMSKYNKNKEVVQIKFITTDLNNNKKSEFYRVGYGKDHQLTSSITYNECMDILRDEKYAHEYNTDINEDNITEIQNSQWVKKYGPYLAAKKLQTSLFIRFDANTCLECWYNKDGLINKLKVYVDNMLVYDM